MELNYSKLRTLDDEWSQFLSSQYQNTAVSLRIKNTTSKLNEPSEKKSLSVVQTPPLELGWDQTPPSFCVAAKAVWDKPVSTTKNGDSIHCSTNNKYFPDDVVRLETPKGSPPLWSCLKEKTVQDCGKGPVTALTHNDDTPTGVSGVFLEGSLKKMAGEKEKLLTSIQSPIAEASYPHLMEEIPEDSSEDSCVSMDRLGPNTYDTFIPNVITPTCDELYISTKTKVLFLNQEIDISRIFWNIPILEYWKPQTGVIKKQMKIVSKTPEEYEETRQKMVREYCYNEHIIKQINNPTARRIKFKDERKITIGISKKDIINTRIKQKNAFYNCFAIIVRMNYEGNFKEIHVKIFNTGKMEIPGVLNVHILETIKPMILSLIQPFLDTPLEYVENKGNENVLINSNFNCGYFIHRERLHALLKSDKYGIEAAYDPCSYPGVKCKFYFNNDIGFVEDGSQNGMILQEDRGMKMSELIENKKYTEVSFMIFRTGSCLIVGNCSEQVLVFIYKFIRNLFNEEYQHIAIMSEDPVIKNKQIKLKKKFISVSV